MSRTFPNLITLVVAALVSATAAGAANAASIDAVCTPGPCGEWKAADVTLEWRVTGFPPGTTTKGCEAFETISAEAEHSRICTASHPSGSLTGTVLIRIDKTAPSVVRVDSSPTANGSGWHTAPVRFTYQGENRGVAGAKAPMVCTVTDYPGPDTPAGAVTGTCRDGAGNVSAPLTHTFKYDATPPALAPIAAEADDRVVKLRWTRSEAQVEITRTPGLGDEAASVVYRGPAEAFTDTNVKNSVTYQYRATVTDPAGQVSTQTVDARPFRGFFAPANGARVTSAPRLEWTAIRNADYYNIQLYRGSRKVLSVWPKNPAFALKPKWKYLGTQFQLAPGTYRVFVWPGIGPFAKQRYGRIVGSRTFVVVRG